MDYKNSFVVVLNLVSGNHNTIFCLSYLTHQAWSIKLSTNELTIQFRCIRHTKCAVLWVPRTRIKNHYCMALSVHNGGLWWRENDLPAELLVNPVGTVSAYWSFSSFSRSNAWTTEACETSSDIACSGDAIFSSSSAPHVLFFICVLPPDLAKKKYFASFFRDVLVDA